MRKLLILMLFGVLFVPMNGSAKADEVLYCVSKLATGMTKQNSTWREGIFERKRFTVKVIGDFLEVTFLYDLETIECTVPSSTSPHQYACRANFSGKTFVYDKNSKRFVYSIVNTSTYLDTDMPVIYAGTREKF